MILLWWFLPLVVAVLWGRAFSELGRPQQGQRLRTYLVVPPLIVGVCLGLMQVPAIQQLGNNDTLFNWTMLELWTGALATAASWLLGLVVIALRWAWQRLKYWLAQDPLRDGI